MPAGDYGFHTITKEGFSNISGDVDSHFHVIAGKVVYIGKLIIGFPSERGLISTTYTITVTDEQKLTEEMLKQEFDSIVTNAENGLQLPEFTKQKTKMGSSSVMIKAN